MSFLEWYSGPHEMKINVFQKQKIEGLFYWFWNFPCFYSVVRSVLANDLPSLLSISQATHQFPMKVAKITIHIPYKDRYPTISLPSSSIPIFNYLIFVEQFVIVLNNSISIGQFLKKVRKIKLMFIFHTKNMIMKFIFLSLSLTRFLQDNFFKSETQWQCIK